MAKVKKPKSVTTSSGGSTTSTVNTNTNTQRGTVINNSTQSNKGWDVQNSTVNTVNRGHQTSYTDVSGLSPETIALQKYVQGNYKFVPSNVGLDKKNAAEAALSAYGPYSSAYSNKINSMLDSIVNRKPFSYDFNNDALYRQYRDNYILQGRQAAQNAAAASASLTGGYGNSYSASAATQANDRYMSELNNRIPELQQLAMSAYDRESDNLMNAYNVLSAAEDREYGRYQDGRTALQSDRDYYGADYYQNRNMESSEHQNALNNAFNMLNYRTDLEKRNVTDSEDTESSTETSKTDTYRESKENNKQTTKDKTTETVKQTQKTSSHNTSSTINNSSSKSSGSSSKKGNSKSGTKTSSSKLNDVISQVKKLETNRQKYEYIGELTKKGIIYPDDFNYIVDLLDIAVPKEDR